VTLFQEHEDELLRSVRQVLFDHPHRLSSESLEQPLPGDHRAESRSDPRTHDSGYRQSRRPLVVRGARQTFAHYGVSDDRYRFFVGDAFEVLQRESIKVDTVLILGFFYHIYRHFEAAALAAATGASHIVLDTAVAKERGPGDAYIEYALEPTNKSGAALGPRAEELIGRPSRRAVELMFGQLGFERCDTDSPVNVDDPTRMEDYRDDRREIFILRRITATPDDSQIQAVASFQ
jgi:hypothetical protein